jgi:AraC family transcriptional regulator of adaptative response / DNA-3-methyladenine glycosylase II
VSPVEFAQTQRLLLAKRLLTDTALPVTEVAMRAASAACAIQCAVQAALRLQPSMLRGTCARASASAEPDMLNFELSFRPPYDWPAVSGFLGARAIAGVEAVENACYRRTVRVPATARTSWAGSKSRLSAKKPRCGRVPASWRVRCRPYCRA